jgi:hypothetical protein
VSDRIINKNAYDHAHNNEHIDCSFHAIILAAKTPLAHPHTGCIDPYLHAKNNGCLDPLSMAIIISSRPLGQCPL